MAAGFAAPEWNGLHARLSAAHALRREMTRVETPGKRLCGRFFDWPVQDCDGLDGKPAVNLKDSTDRKEPRSIGTGTAGMVHAGDREQ
ncbi:MAG: hypothetical protein ACKOOL_01460 [Novosphingobium sp.]